jgi:hypothetical protein
LSEQDEGCSAIARLEKCPTLQQLLSKDHPTSRIFFGFAEPGAGDFYYAWLGQKEEAFMQTSIDDKVDIVLRQMNSHTLSPIRTERTISACIIDIDRLAEKLTEFKFSE